MIHFFPIDGACHLIVVGSMQLAVAPIGVDAFEVFASKAYPVFDRDEIAALEAAIELSVDAKGKCWDLTNGLLSGLHVDLSLLIKALYESRYLWFIRPSGKFVIDDETLFVRYGKGMRTLSCGIIPIIGITAKEYIERDSEGYFRRTDADSL